jgi:hypothetical protein
LIWQRQQYPIDMMMTTNVLLFILGIPFQTRTSKGGIFQLKNSSLNLIFNHLKIQKTINEKTGKFKGWQKLAL